MKNLIAVLLMTVAFSCQKERVDAECVEKPSDGRACTYDYTPVCGCNGKTYGNACGAEAVGITNYTKGECSNGK